MESIFFTFGYLVDFFTFDELVDFLPLVSWWSFYLWWVGDFLYLWWVGSDIVEDVDKNKEESNKQGHPACNHFGKYNHDPDHNPYHLYYHDDDFDCDDDDGEADLGQCQGVWEMRSRRRQRKVRRADSRWWCTTSRVAQESETELKVIMQIDQWDMEREVQWFQT